MGNRNPVIRSGNRVRITFFLGKALTAAQVRPRMRHPNHYPPPEEEAIYETHHHHSRFDLGCRDHQVLRDAPGFSHGEVSRCLRSRQSIWCSPQGWDTPGFSHGEEVTLGFTISTNSFGLIGARRDVTYFSRFRMVCWADLAGNM